MRRDFDFVLMGDYGRDMDDLAEISARAISILRKEKQELELLVAQLVHYAGGKVTIPRSAAVGQRRYELITSYDVAGDSTVYQTPPPDTPKRPA